MSATLTENQLRTIAMLAEGKGHRVIAESLGVSTRTIDRWALLPEVRQEVERLKVKALNEIAKRSQETITRLVPGALNVIAATLKDPEARASDKLRAADIVGKWAGLTQVAIASTNQPLAEAQLQDYLAYLSAKNGVPNGNGASQH